MLRAPLLALSLALPTLSAGCVVHTRSHAHAGHVDVVVYPHGHRRHVCDHGCGHWVRPSRSVVVYSHGHARHCGDEGCSFYVFPHGHHRHACGRGCGYWRPAPVVVSPAPVVVIHPHGHRLHTCGGGCASFRVVVHPHGHHLHVCGQGCRPGASYGRPILR